MHQCTSGLFENSKRSRNFNNVYSRIQKRYYSSERNYKTYINLSCINENSLSFYNALMQNTTLSKNNNNLIYQYL